VPVAESKPRGGSGCATLCQQRPGLLALLLLHGRRIVAGNVSVLRRNCRVVVGGLRLGIRACSLRLRARHRAIGRGCSGGGGKGDLDAGHALVHPRVEVGRPAGGAVAAHGLGRLALEAQHFDPARRSREERVDRGLDPLEAAAVQELPDLARDAQHVRARVVGDERPGDRTPLPLRQDARHGVDRAVVADGRVAAPLRCKGLGFLLADRRALLHLHGLQTHGERVLRPEGHDAHRLTAGNPATRCSRVSPEPRPSCRAPR
jgi:hypothetical protein